MAAKYAFKMTTREGTYFVDSETGEFIDDVTGYEVLSFGPEVDELPDLEDIQEETPSAKGALSEGGITAEQKELMKGSGSGDTISRRTPRDDKLRPMGPRQELTKPQTKAEKAAVKAGGFVTGKVLGGIGTAIGMGVAGPLGAVAGGLLGNLAGGKLGAGIINDMRTNPQTMALPGKTTQAGPSRVAVPKNAPRSNPLMSPVTRAPLGPVGAPRSAASVVAPVSISAPPSVGPMPVNDLTFEDVNDPAFQTPAINPDMPNRPVSPTPIGNAPAVPVGRIDRSPLASVSPLNAAPIGAVARSPLDPVARAAAFSPVNAPTPAPAPRARSNPLFGGAKVTTPDQQQNPMLSAQSRQVMPSLDYDRFSRTKAPSVNWGAYDPDQLDPYTRGKVEEAQSKLGFSLNITSGFRDADRNKAVGGARGSQHVHGRAVDISMKGLTDSQRADVVAALGSVAEPGKARIGAYTGNTGLHFDTAEHATTAYGGVHPMYDSTINNIDKAPSWFSTGLSAVRDKDFGRLAAQAPRDPFSPEAIAATQPQARQTATPGAYSSAPAGYASSGLYSRPQEEREKMGFTIAGELSGKTLKGLQRNDPVARAELANVVATMENRAHSTRYAGDINKALSPSQYNSLTRGALDTTRANWGAYGTDITKAIDDFYSGRNKPTTPEATHYANYDVVTPSWDSAAVNKTKVGDHVFSTVNIPGTKQPEYTPSPAFQAQFDKAIRDEVNKQTQVSFDIGRAAVSPVTAPTIGVARAQQPDQVTKPTTFSQTMTAGYPTATTANRPASMAPDVMAEEATTPFSGTTRTKGIMGAAKDEGPVGVSRTLDAIGRSSGAVSRSQMDALGVSRDYAGGMTMSNDRGGVSYSRADGSTRNPDGTSYDPWGGMRSGVMGGGSSRGGGIGPGGSGPSDPSR